MLDPTRPVKGELMALWKVIAYQAELIEELRSRNATG